MINAIANHNLQGQHLFYMGSETLRPLTRLITGHNNLKHYQNLIEFTMWRDAHLARSKFTAEKFSAVSGRSS